MGKGEKVQQEYNVCALTHTFCPIMTSYISTYFVPLSKPIIKNEWKYVSGPYVVKYMRSFSSNETSFNPF